MLKIKIIKSDDDTYAGAMEALLQPPDKRGEIEAQVREMTAEIERDGDAALMRYSKKFDKFKPRKASGFEVSEERLLAAEDALPQQLRDDLTLAAKRLRDYHRRQLPRDWEYTDSYGNRIGELIKPVERAVIYAPGGTAAYPSSVLMGVIPAIIAGVSEVVLTTPAPGGKPPAVTLGAAALADCDRVFMLGGAQAIIGFALGTDTLPVADVIAGPGNAYVAEAKRQMFGTVGVDSIAGPSEVLIIADGSAPAEWAAADMAAQAEHDVDAQSILISDNEEYVNKVIEALKALLPSLPRADIVAKSLTNRGAFILADTITECCEIANDIAPEHLQIMVDDPEDLVADIKHAGSIFVGSYACVPFGDYLAGANHVLPTAGAARFSSPLGVYDFVKRSGVFYATPAGAAALAAPTGRLAEAEGLAAHAHAARLRRRRSSE